MNRLMVEQLYREFFKGFIAFNALFVVFAVAVQSDSFADTARVILS